MTFNKHPFELAALATAAMPGLRVTELREPQYDDGVVEVTGIVDTQGDAWLIVLPRLEMSDDEVARVIEVSSFLGQEAASGILPFAVPQIGGMVRVDGSCLFVFRRPGGFPLGEDSGLGDTLLAASLGTALASLHNLPTERFAQTDIPVISPDAARHNIRHLIGVAGRRVPPSLRRRWLAAVDEEVLWSYTPTPTHGELSPKSVWTEMSAVIAIMDFWRLSVADPATDIAWMLPLADDVFLERFNASYSRARTQPDLHLMLRAQLYSELALVQWLNYGIASADQGVIDEAESMLAELDADLGGAWLIEPSTPVAEIDFTAAEEPLERIRAADEATSATENVSMTEVHRVLDVEESAPEPSPADLVVDEVAQTEEELESYEYPPIGAGELHTEDLSEIVDEVLSASDEERDA